MSISDTVVGYVKLHVRAKLPSSFQHVDAVWSPRGEKLLGLFFFFDGRPGTAREAAQKASSCGYALRAQYGVASVISRHDETGAAEEISTVDGRIDARAA